MHLCPLADDTRPHREDGPRPGRSALARLLRSVVLLLAIPVTALSGVAAETRSSKVQQVRRVTVKHQAVGQITARPSPVGLTSAGEVVVR